ncbi:MAG: low specificity L-threonine aldolase [Deltaproteobacteria bacterium]|nr:MAG: low specificity L-threonine aldolase [Deltaproteobacteria bacterium]
MQRTFASDNYSGVCPEVMEALQQANTGHVSGYGNDPFTNEAKQLFAEEFGPDCQVYFVYNGTAANVLSLRAMTRSYHSIVCSEHSHIYIHETGAAQSHTGCKVMALPSHDGKLSLETVQHAVERESYWGHHATKPKVLSITQPTELGVIYTPDEVKTLADYCHNNDLYLHMDGCRLFNAAASLDLSLAEASTEAGVDVLSFGGTKNGLMFGEAIVFLRPELAHEFDYLHKESLQLASKMRFIAAQYIPFLKDKIWHKNASQANRIARLLAQGLSQHPEIDISFPVQTNQIFATFPPSLIEELNVTFPFYTWNDTLHQVRLVTSFDNTEEDAQHFLEKVGVTFPIK